MSSVKVFLDKQDSHLSLQGMKEWIDQIGFTPVRFNYDINNAGKLSSVRIDFLSDIEADIFCRQFDGEVVA